MPPTRDRHSVRPLLCRTALFFAVLCVWAAGARAAAVFDRLSGVWQAVAEDSFVKRLRLTGDDSGFRVHVALADGREWEAAFAPGPRPAVYVAAEEGGGIFDWFTSRQEGRPLEGDPVDWARTTPGELVLYRLKIGSSGRFSLLRLALRPERQAVTVGVIEHLHAAQTLRREERLAPAEEQDR